MYKQYFRVVYVKRFTVEKLTGSDVFTVVMMGTRDHDVYRASTAILFTIQNQHSKALNAFGCLVPISTSANKSYFVWNGAFHINPL